MALINKKEIILGEVVEQRGRGSPGAPGEVPGIVLDPLQ